MHLIQHTERSYRHIDYRIGSGVLFIWWNVFVLLPVDDALVSAEKTISSCWQKQQLKPMLSNSIKMYVCSKKNNEKKLVNGQIYLCAFFFSPLFSLHWCWQSTHNGRCWCDDDEQLTMSLIIVDDVVVGVVAQPSKSASNTWHHFLISFCTSLSFLLFLHSISCSLWDVDAVAVVAVIIGSCHILLTSK